MTHVTETILNRGCAMYYSPATTLSDNQIGEVVQLASLRRQPFIPGLQLVEERRIKARTLNFCTFTRGKEKFEKP